MLDIINAKYSVLNHGFIRVVDCMGNDSSVVQAARVSYGKGTKSVNDDRGLINYLMRHHHTTPFEMCEIKLHIKLPIFVARQWVRHRTANINEYSARYSVLDKEFYIPEKAIIKEQSKTNKQGRDEDLPDDVKSSFVEKITANSEKAYADYMYMLEAGVCRELARIFLPVNFYTQMYWKIDLHNLLHFLRLRLDKKAQYEIRAYAQIIADIVSKWVPYSYEAFYNKASF